MITQTELLFTYKRLDDKGTIYEDYYNNLMDNFEKTNFDSKQDIKEIEIIQKKIEEIGEQQTMLLNSIIFQ